MLKPSFNIADIQSASKRLNSVENVEAKKADSKPIMDESEKHAIESLENIYIKHNGNIDDIFHELKEDPTKAKRPKHCPKNARDFAEKYIQGRYSVINNDDNDDNDDKNDDNEYKSSQHK
jgi:hypothetical protein